MDVVVNLGTVEAAVLLASLISVIGYLVERRFQRLDKRIADAEGDFSDKVKYLHSRVDQLIQLLQRHADSERKEKR